ncbi:MAG: DUF2101 family protein [Methanobacterium sp.]
MKFFKIFGDIIIRMLNFIGMLILEIPNIPNIIRGIDKDNLKERVDTDTIKDNISKIKNDSRIQESISKISNVNINEGHNEKTSIKTQNVSNKIQIDQLSEEYSSEVKERTVFMLQIVSGAFLVVSMLFIFNFLSITIYGILAVISVAYILYTLFSKIKLMFKVDFNAYRDFFLMYVVVGIILVVVGTNPNFVMSYSFEFLPSLSVLIFAVIAVIAVFLIFRIKHHRNYTYGTVIESGKRTAYVKVDYDICSNIKPDIYIVDNSYGAVEGDKVKLQIEEKLLSMSGNKPVSIIETLN